MVVKREKVIEINGEENEFFHSKWVARSMKLKIEKDVNALYIIYMRQYPYDKNWSVPISWKTYDDMKFDRFQIETGYQIDIHIPNAINYGIKTDVTISFVPRRDEKIYDGYIYQKRSQIQTFDVPSVEVKKIERYFSKK